MPIYLFSFLCKIIHASASIHICVSPALSLPVSAYRLRCGRAGQRTGQRAGQGDERQDQRRCVGVCLGNIPHRVRDPSYLALSAFASTSANKLLDCVQRPGWPSSPAARGNDGRRKGQSRSARAISARREERASREYTPSARAALLPLK